MFCFDACTKASSSVQGRFTLVFLHNAQIFRLLLKISVKENNSNESVNQFFIALPCSGAPKYREEFLSWFGVCTNGEVVFTTSLYVTA